MGHVRIRGSHAAALTGVSYSSLDDWLCPHKNTTWLTHIALEYVGCDRRDRTNLDVPIGSHLQAETPLDT